VSKKVSISTDILGSVITKYKPDLNEEKIQQYFYY
jgi:hypothetical protein